MLVAWCLVLTLALPIPILLLVSGLVFTCDVSPLTNQSGLLDSSLLHCVDLLKTDSLHFGLHRSKNEIASTRLQGLMGLLADQDLVWWALRADSRGLVDGLADQRKLWLSLTDDTSDYLTCMDANFDTQFLGVSERLSVHIGLHTAGKISHTDGMMAAK